MSWYSACWGIGGKYGRPVLHHLVTTVRDGPKLADRHVTRFGFREFWKEGFHFYLNGRRIFIQGDNIGSRSNSSRPEQVIWQHLLRRDNINAIRTHFEPQQGMYARVADELGMLIIPQLYPQLFMTKRRRGDLRPVLSVEEFLATPLHHVNLKLYANWVRWLRNHPSIVFYSTDNELYTQARDTAANREWKIRNDRMGAVYGRYVKAMDPTRIVSRSGDQGTWRKLGRWQQHPPAEIANYHYPDFNCPKLVENWQSLYERPVLFGETLYCAYGAWNGWIDAIGSQVAAKAARCRRVIGLYRDLEIPGWVGMGIGLDGFTELKADGSGNPWGVTPRMKAEYKAGGRVKALPRYPHFPIDWPSHSGPGLKPEFFLFRSHYGFGSVNAYFAERPKAVANAVNTAYRESSHPMPPLVQRRMTEALITVTAGGRPLPFAHVVLVPMAGQAAAPVGVLADSNGRAWFVLGEAGAYELRAEGQPRSVRLDVKELPFEAKAGFDYLPRITAEVGS